MQEAKEADEVVAVLGYSAPSRRVLPVQLQAVELVDGEEHEEVVDEPAAPFLGAGHLEKSRG